MTTELTTVFPHLTVTNYLHKKKNTVLALVEVLGQRQGNHFKYCTGTTEMHARTALEKLVSLSMASSINNYISAVFVNWVCFSDSEWVPLTPIIAIYLLLTDLQ